MIIELYPAADHGASLGPPTADVAARCLSMLGQLGEVPASNPVVARGVDYLLRTQENDGSWFGRWGMNYIYGTWSVLCALNAVQRDPRSAEVQKAVAWLKTIQNKDGGWGEGGRVTLWIMQATVRHRARRRKRHGLCLG